MKEWRGWLISVELGKHDNRQPMSKLYAARISEPDAAMLAVSRYAKITNETARILIELSLSQLRGMKVPDGKACLIQSAS